MCCTIELNDTLYLPQTLVHLPSVRLGGQFILPRVSFRSIIPHDQQKPKPTSLRSQQTLSFITRHRLLSLLDNLLCLGNLQLTCSSLLGALNLVFELLKRVGDALAEGREDSFGFLDCSSL
jgi:hypothetical protein